MNGADKTKTNDTEIKRGDFYEQKDDDGNGYSCRNLGGEHGGASDEQRQLDEAARDSEKGNLHGRADEQPYGQYDARDAEINKTAPKD